MKEIRFWDIVKFALLVTVTIDGITRLTELTNKYRPRIVIENTKTSSSK